MSFVPHLPPLRHRNSSSPCASCGTVTTTRHQTGTVWSYKNICWLSAHGCWLASWDPLAFTSVQAGTQLLFPCPAAKFYEMLEEKKIYIPNTLSPSTLIKTWFARVTKIIRCGTNTDCVSFISTGNWKFTYFSRRKKTKKQTQRGKVGNIPTVIFSCNTACMRNSNWPASSHWRLSSDLFFNQEISGSICCCC